MGLHTHLWIKDFHIHTCIPLLQEHKDFAKVIVAIQRRNTKKTTASRKMATRKKSDLLKIYSEEKAMPTMPMLKHLQRLRLTNTCVSVGD